MVKVICIKSKYLNYSRQTVQLMLHALKGFPLHFLLSVAQSIKYDMTLSKDDKEKEQDQVSKCFLEGNELTQDRS